MTCHRLRGFRRSSSSPLPTVECGSADFPADLVRHGPTLQVRIGFDYFYEPGDPVPTVPAFRRSALVDTGAQETSIDADLALALSLPVAGSQRVAGVHGSREVTTYHAQIYVPSLHWVIAGQFAGVQLASEGMPFHALIGRHFLRHARLTYDGPTGSVTLSTD